MAKRSTNLGVKPKSRHSHKTKKRLVIKKEMLAKKVAGRKHKVTKKGIGQVLKVKKIQ
jgi:hypothetical protein